MSKCPTNEVDPRDCPVLAEGGLLRQTHDTVLQIQGDLKRYAEKLESVYTTVYGNGKPGLKEKVTEHSEFIKFWKRFMWLAAGAAAVPISGGIIAGGVWIIRSMK